MKKNRLLVILSLICVFQLSIPFGVMCVKEFATENGLQGKLKVEYIWYYEDDEELWFQFQNEFYSELDHKRYTSIHTDDEGFLVVGGSSIIKPQGAHLDPDKLPPKRILTEKIRLDLKVSEKELYDILFDGVCDRPYGTMNFYVTVSVFEGELILKEFWVDDTKLLEFR